MANMDRFRAEVFSPRIPHTPSRPPSQTGHPPMSAAYQVTYLSSVLVIPKGFQVHAFGHRSHVMPQVLGLEPVARLEVCHRILAWQAGSESAQNA